MTVSLETVPKELRHLRACLLCGLVKTLEQFELDGCDNCEEYMQIKDSREAVLNCTSANFDGLIGMMSPHDSWVAKWQRVDQLVPGVYAVSVSGSLSSRAIRELRARGINYRTRDTSQKN